tara:strand:- start:758 stop:1462 length:705 start_codon:yes stop_codon:yes gene_type:complete
MINNLSVLGLIPARGGSKGVPKKNIKLLNGIPLINYTIKAAKKANYIDKLIVSTDNDEISSICKDQNVEVPFVRPKNLSDDQAKSIDVIIHALKFIEKQENRLFDLILYLEPPSPLRTYIDINESLEIFVKKKPDSLVSVHEANQFHPILMKKIRNNYLEPIWKNEPEGIPRQLYSPTAYMRNGAIYIFKRDNILNNILYGDKVFPYIMPIEKSICIDDIKDWYVAEQLIINEK